MSGNMIAILEKHHPDELGFLPQMIDQNDPRPAREQFNANYQHGGGWQPILGFKRRKNVSIQYPGDPIMHPIAMWPLRDEMIVVYRYGIVAIFQTKTGEVEVARMD